MRPLQGAAFAEALRVIVNGPSPISIVVADDLAEARSFVAYLKAAAPLLTSARCEEVDGDWPPRRANAAPAEPAVVAVSIEDGTDAESLDRWRRLGTERDALVAKLLDHHSDSRRVFVVTETRAPAALDAARDAASALNILTVGRFAEPVPEADPLGAAAKAALTELEGRYGLTTDELLDALFERRSVPASGQDLARWKAAAALVRRPD